MLLEVPGCIFASTRTRTHTHMPFVTQPLQIDSNLDPVFEIDRCQDRRGRGINRFVGVDFQKLILCPTYIYVLFFCLKRALFLFRPSLLPTLRRRELCRGCHCHSVCCLRGMRRGDRSCPAPYPPRSLRACPFAWRRV